MTTMEKLVEAYLDKERIIKEQAEAIMKLQSELSNLETKLKEEKEVNSWCRRVVRELFYGKVITKEDRKQGERFKSRLVEFDPDEAKRIDDLVRKEVDGFAKEEK